MDSFLDRNVTVIDPRAGEERFKAFLDRSGREPSLPTDEPDVPEVEDFPLSPKEETEDVQHLAITLQLRALRAHEHWNGNTQARLSDIIRQCIKR